MAKAMHFMKKRDVEKTISIMKSFVNTNKKLISLVSNKISFLYFVEGDITNTDKQANLAIENKRYKHKALVKMDNIHFQKEDYVKTKSTIQKRLTCKMIVFRLFIIWEWLIF